MAGIEAEKREFAGAVENIDRMMIVIGIKSWLALGTVFLVFAAVLIWGFGGTMQIREEVSGVLVRSGRLAGIYAAGEGILLDFVPVQGMFVERDQTLARIDRPDLVREINLLLDAGVSGDLVETKRAELFRGSRIVTWEAGRVLDTYVHRGDYVTRGQKLAAISREAEQSTALECLLFVPADQLRKIRKGLPVSIYPASVSRKTYGNMTGTISIISEYPVTWQYLADRLNSESLADFFLKDSACYEVYLNLVSSGETVTGYAWTTSLGPSAAFGDLTLCTATIVIDEPRPVDVFFGNREE
jgi:hypothetical protein